MIDKIISEIDFALKLFSVPPKGVRKNPADKISKKLAKTKFGQKKEKGLKKLDNFLQKSLRCFTSFE